MAHVHTPHGVGEIVDSESLRGRTQYKVAGPGWTLWLDATKCAAATTVDDGNAFDNSTTLPYNPSPQFPTELFAQEQAIQPGDYSIDADERLHSSDSRSFKDKKPEHKYPGPDSMLFAGPKPWEKESANYPLGPGYERPGFEDEAVQEYVDHLQKHDYLAPAQKILPWTNDDWERAEAHDPTDKYRNHPDSWSHQPTEQDYADWEARHGSLGPKYATWMLAAPEADDSLSRFKRDPIQEINRQGYLLTAGQDFSEMEDYGHLIEADSHIRQAAWSDVREKAQRLRREGRVKVEHLTPNNIYAKVDGDHGEYTVMIQKTGGQSIDQWACSCDWGKWAYKRKISYVGRLCSHGYASYLEMQSANAKKNPGKFYPGPAWEKRIPRTHMMASITDDFKDYADDFNDGHIDMDAADNFIDLPERDKDYSDDQVDEIYDYARENQTQRKQREFKVPYTFDPEKVWKSADVLHTSPQSLTPDLIEVPEGEDSEFVDVTEDERDTTGPEGIVHEGRYAFVDANGNGYNIRTAQPEAPLEEDDDQPGLTPADADTADPSTPPADSTTDPATAGETAPADVVADPAAAQQQVPGSYFPQEQGGGGMAGGGMGSFDPSMIISPVIQGISGIGMPIAEGIGQGLSSAMGNLFAMKKASSDDLLNELRSLSDKGPEPGHADSHNDKVRDVIEELRDRGADVDQIVASIRQADAQYFPSNPNGWDNYHWDIYDKQRGLKDPTAVRPDQDIRPLTQDPFGPQGPLSGPRPGLVPVADPSSRPQGNAVPFGPKDYFRTAGGGFDEEGGPEWVDRDFAGSGPDSKDWWGTSEEGVEEFDRSGSHQDVDVFESDDDEIIKYTKDTPQQKASSNDVVRQFQASGGGALATGPGGGGSFSDDDIAANAKSFLKKTAGRVYSVAEQDELMKEAHPQGARNMPNEDDLRDTHYLL